MVCAAPKLWQVVCCLFVAGGKDAADFYTHSMGLGAGAEGMLGFALAAITEVGGQGAS